MGNHHYRTDTSSRQGELRRGSVLAERFRLLAPMGGGRMTEIWHAEDMSLGREVALKAMRPEGNPDPAAYATLLREGELLARLRHPGVLQVHDVGSDLGVVFLVTQLVRGAPLDAVIRRLGARSQPGDLSSSDLLACLEGEPDPGRAHLFDRAHREDWFRTSAHIMVQILRALEAVHARNVVHRDIKPANIVLSGSGDPVLVDFGFGGDVHDAAPTASRLSCTPHYVAPEQLARMNTGHDVRTDIYQAGLLFYELLTLRKCFGEAHSVDLYTAILHGRYAHPEEADPRIPSELSRICLNAIATSPTERYANAIAFRRELESFLGGRTAFTAHHDAQSKPRRFLRFLAAAPLFALLAGVLRIWLREV